MRWHVIATLLAVTWMAVEAHSRQQQQQEEHEQFDSLSDHTNYGSKKHAKEHVAEHLADMGMNDVEMSEEEQLFYYFSLHDHNRDRHLDGNELRVALTDFDHEIGMDLDFTVEDIADMIDHALKEDDRNNDGKISWEEYLESQKYHEE